jgi:glycerol-3-phosphate acyltransferase PlsY
VLGGYLAGSVLFGMIAARHAGIDLHAVGSGNVGATNVERALGKRTGRVVLVLDALKGLLPTVGASVYFGSASPWTAGTAFATAMGHTYPIFYRFQGGKAAATSVGALLGAFWPAGVAAALTFVALKKLSRRASVGSLGAITVALGVCFALAEPAILALAGALFALVVWRHRANVVRLVRGEEPASGEEPSP